MQKLKEYRHSKFWQIIESQILGTRFQNYLWKYRQFIVNGWLQSYRDALDQPHRHFLIKQIQQFYPTSILEIGCCSGTNLVLLAKALPHASIDGVDINNKAIDDGRNWMRELGIDSNVRLNVSNADNLNRYSDKIFDVTFTSALLMYIGPDKVSRVVNEIVRVTRREIVHLEWAHSKPNHPSSVYSASHWIHNFNSLYWGFGDLKSERIPDSGIFTDKLWNKYGTLITVTL